MELVEGNVWLGADLTIRLTHDVGQEPGERWDNSP
jgi:hypothetical protein